MSTNLEFNNPQFLYNKELSLAQIAVKHSSEAIQFIDKLGKSLYHNNAFINLFGYSVEQINEAGGPYAVFSDPEKPKIIMAHLEYRDFWEGNVQLHDFTGTIVPVYMRLVAVKDIHSEPVTNICYYHALSQSRELQSERDHYFKKIEEAEKLARLGYFSSAISHEINNPLNIIQTKLFFLKRRLTQIYPEKSDESWEHIEKINQQVIRLSNLANSILQYAKHRVKKDFLVNVNQVILHTINSFKEMIPASIKVIINLAPDLNLIPADELGLEIVLKNIFTNAVESIPTNGQVKISTKNFSNKFIEIIIQDNGVGIPEESLSKVFNPFYTNKDKSGSYGLGLSLCENIINEHDGQITLRSKENVGTEFIIHLPCL